MLNRRAAELIAASRPPAMTWHDWWSYIVVAAAGGTVLVDRTATILYRQHNGNQIGNAGPFWRRAIAAARRGRQPFMSLFRGHVAALEQDAGWLAEPARQQVRLVAQALAGGAWRRLLALRLPGLRRQTWQETLIFRLWFVLG
jgi:hypothetical protein